MTLLKLTQGKYIQLIIKLVVACTLLLVGALFYLTLTQQLSTSLLMAGLGLITLAFLFISGAAVAQPKHTYPEKPDLHKINESESLNIIRQVGLKDIKHTMQDDMKVGNHHLKHQIEARRYMEMLLRVALTKNQFVLLFQPKMSTKSGRICSVEALLRWYHPELGWFSPEVFIPIAEESGLISPLGHWVLSTVCEKIKKWHEMGYDYLKVSVNLSGHQFKKGDLVEDIANILWQTQITPYSLELELTESVLMENTEKYVLMLDVLKSMGIAISIDDFGTGYSALSYLRRFPIDTLKIDKSFIRDINKKTQDEDSIIQAIIAMAKGLKIKTVAEGVETKEQADFLIAQGVDELQGYYISMPLTEDELLLALHEDKAQVIAFKH